MNKLLGVPMLALLLALVSIDTVQAGWCGAARYRCCASCCCNDGCGYAAVKQQCCTVTKTCKEVVYEQQSYTCYKTIMEPVCENQTVDCVTYVPETCYRTCEYTV